MTHQQVDQELVALRTCHDMLIDREYTIIEFDPENKIITARKPCGSNMSVFINPSPKFDTKSMKDIFSLMNSAEVTHSLVIFQQNITAATNAALHKSSGMRIELFSVEDLQYNITKHRLQPIFQRLSNDDADEFKKKFDTKLPILKFGNPIAKYFDYDKGDIIRIIRKVGEQDFITYRIVR